jgi:hypothetical protein
MESHLIYHTYDVVKGLAKISICVPIKKEIFISYGATWFLENWKHLKGKTTLTGDYSHKDGYDKGLAFLNKTN